MDMDVGEDVYVSGSTTFVRRHMQNAQSRLRARRDTRVRGVKGQVNDGRYLGLIAVKSLTHLNFDLRVQRRVHAVYHRGGIKFNLTRFARHMQHLFNPKQAVFSGVSMSDRSNNCSE